MCGGMSIQDSSSPVSPSGWPASSGPAQKYGGDSPAEYKKKYQWQAEKLSSDEELWKQFRSELGASQVKTGVGVQAILQQFIVRNIMLSEDSREDEDAGVNESSSSKRRPQKHRSMSRLEMGGRRSSMAYFRREDAGGDSQSTQSMWSGESRKQQSYRHVIRGEAETLTGKLPDKEEPVLKRLVRRVSNANTAVEAKDDHTAYSLHSLQSLHSLPAAIPNMRSFKPFTSFSRKTFQDPDAPPDSAKPAKPLKNLSFSLKRGSARQILDDLTHHSCATENTTPKPPPQSEHPQQQDLLDLFYEVSGPGSDELPPTFSPFRKSLPNGSYHDNTSFIPLKNNDDDAPFRNSRRRGRPSLSSFHSSFTSATSNSAAGNLIVEWGDYCDDDDDDDDDDKDYFGYGEDDSHSSDSESSFYPWASASDSEDDDTPLQRDDSIYRC